MFVQPIAEINGIVKISIVRVNSMTYIQLCLDLDHKLQRCNRVFDRTQLSIVNFIFTRDMQHGCLHVWHCIFQLGDRAIWTKLFKASHFISLICLQHKH